MQKKKTKTTIKTNAGRKKANQMEKARRRKNRQRENAKKLER